MRNLQGRFRIALIGPPGSGKTTTAWFVQRLVPGAVILSVASPLREIEEFIYRRMGRLPPSVTGTQDGQLLQTVRGLLLERDPTFLESAFVSMVESYPDAPIVNDDCRRALYPRLRSLGFSFVWVSGSHLANRPDTTAPRINTGLAHDDVVPKDDCDYVLDNTGSFETLLSNLSAFLRSYGSNV
jgi:energy-coupling factor transporter ATP-binding protein EcfA2